MNWWGINWLVVEWSDIVIMRLRIFTYHNSFWLTRSNCFVYSGQVVMSEALEWGQVDFTIIVLCFTLNLNFQRKKQVVKIRTYFLSGNQSCNHKILLPHGCTPISLESGWPTNNSHFQQWLVRLTFRCLNKWVRFASSRFCLSLHKPIQNHTVSTVQKKNLQEIEVDCWRVPLRWFDHRSPHKRQHHHRMAVSALCICQTHTCDSHGQWCTVCRIIHSNRI